MTKPASLKRSLTLTQLTLYGLGTTIGAGIYALVGEVAAAAGSYAPVSFVIAALLVGFTALSFAEMAARYPKSAGEAVYVQQGFGSPRFAALVGLMVVAAGVVSSATIVTAFVGYVQAFVGMPGWLAVVLLMAVMTGLAVWGISESVSAAALFTLLEIAGLLLIIWAGGDSLAELPERWREVTPPADIGIWSAVFAGAFLAFYAFIGFEDMVNVAEEVKDVSRAMPIAIVITLVATLLLYLLVALVAVLAVPIDELAASEAPLALVFERAGGGSARLIGAIGIIAMVNGALIQMIMASRVLYGLAGQSLLPAALGAVHPRTRTPVQATLLVAAVILVLALWLPLGTLARVTSAIALAVFAAVNLSLLRVKRREPAPPGQVVFPAWVPAAGALVSLGVLLIEGLRLLLG